MRQETRDKGQGTRESACGPSEARSRRAKAGVPNAAAALGWPCGGGAPRASGKSLATLMLLLILCLVAGSAIAAQPPTTPDGFVPASSLPNQEQLPAAPLVIGAYSIVWLLVFGYLWSIWNRIGRAERDLADVSRRIAASQRQ
jgi:CcmD family protein